MRKRRYSGWFYLAGIILGTSLFCVLLVSLWLLRSKAAAESHPTAVLTMIFAPTSTPTLSPGSLSPTATTTQTVVIEGIGMGLYVQISGTGGDGLRLRAEANTTSDVKFLGYESEVFKVTGGPKNADEYVWWFLTAPYDESRSGWAVSNFIQPIEVQP